MILGVWTKTYIKIKGKNAYLYRAVDSNGETIDFCVSGCRTKGVAKRFLRKDLKATHNQMPRVITTDLYPATEMAMLEETHYGDLSWRTEHRMCKYLNNIVEQDHRFIKKKTKAILGFKCIGTARKTISGIEIIHMVHKGQVEAIRCARSEVRFINKVMSEVA